MISAHCAFTRRFDGWLAICQHWQSHLSRCDGAKDNRLCNTVHSIVGITYGNSGLARGEARRGVYSAYARTPCVRARRRAGQNPGQVRQPSERLEKPLAKEASARLAAHAVAGMLINPTEGTVLDRRGGLYRIIHLPDPFCWFFKESMQARGSWRVRHTAHFFRISDENTYATRHTADRLVSSSKRPTSVLELPPAAAGNSR
jgi:hypothetical protein